MIVHPDPNVGIELYPASCFFGVKRPNKMDASEFDKIEKDIRTMAENVFLCENS